VSGQTVTNAVEQRKPQTPGALIKAYSKDFATVLPTHIGRTRSCGSRRAR
jgi:hypothetical protein